MSDVRRLAAIDIGTVTTRLLIADVGPQSIEEVVRSTDITHLGEGLAAAGRLSAEAMERVGEVLARYARTMRECGVERYTALATSASRDAANGVEFAALAADCGIDLTIISGSREAELAFAGASFEHRGEGLLAVDCGGGSTELVLGDVVDTVSGRDQRIIAARSFDVGSRRMTERFLHSDPPTRTELTAAAKWAAEEIRPFFDRLERRPTTMIGLAGTATSLAAIRLQLAEYDAAAVHGYELSGADIADTLEMLASMRLDARMNVVGLHPGRAQVIVAGTLILETVLALAGLDTMLVSEHDILYGILLDTYRHLQE